MPLATKHGKVRSLWYRLQQTSKDNELTELRNQVTMLTIERNRLESLLDEVRMLLNR